MTKKLSLAEISAARKRTTERNRIEPRAESVTYDDAQELIVLYLHGGAILALPLSTIRELQNAQPKELRTIRAGFDGESISLDALDIDISIPGLLRDLVGMTSAAALLGRKGGAATSEVKSAAVRENGKRGGRPRKTQQLA